MADETTTPTTITDSDGTELTIENGVLSLLPPVNGPVYECLRLGLTFDHADSSGETWTDYTSGLQGTFTDRKADAVTLSDMDTKTSATVPLTILSKVEHVTTWRTSQSSTDGTDAQGQPSA